MSTWGAVADPPAHRMLYVVTAAASRDVEPLPLPGQPGRRVAMRPEPVGVQHAVSHVLRHAPASVSLCGAIVRDWHVFPHVMFDVRQHAACQRCAQLVEAATAGPRQAPPAAQV